MFKQFAFIWPAALALGLLNRFTINHFVTSTSSTLETVSGITMLVYVAILMAMFIIAFVAAIQRFYKGLLGDEGYLMHTLPVKTWGLIGSKLLCAVVMTVISIIVALASILLVLPWDSEDFKAVFRALGELFSNWNSNNTHAAIAMLEVLILMLVSLALGYLMLYLAMGIGHLFQKSRVAWSVGAFIVINSVWNMIQGRLIYEVFSSRGAFVAIYNESEAAMTLGHRAIWINIGVELVGCIIFFAVTEYILRKRLNLE